MPVDGLGRPPYEIGQIVLSFALGPIKHAHPLFSVESRDVALFPHGAPGMLPRGNLAIDPNAAGRRNWHNLSRVAPITSATAAFFVAGLALRLLSLTTIDTTMHSKLRISSTSPPRA